MASSSSPWRVISGAKDSWGGSVGVSELEYEEWLTVNEGLVKAAWNQRDELARMTVWALKLERPPGPYLMVMSENCSLLMYLK